MFKSITYLYMLYETLREYFAVNAMGQLSIMYRYCASCLQALQPTWDNYDAFRNDKKIIAQCKWTKTQVENTLNYIFNVNSIYIIQSSALEIFAPTFDNESSLYGYLFDDIAPSIYAGMFDDTILINNVIIKIPNTLTKAEVENVVNQIIISGLTYTIDFI